MESVNVNSRVTHGPSSGKSALWTLQRPQSRGLPGVESWLPVQPARILGFAGQADPLVHIITRVAQYHEVQST